MNKGDLIDGAKRAGKIPSAIWALGFVSLLIDVSSEMIHSLLLVEPVAVTRRMAGTNLLP